MSSIMSNNLDCSDVLQTDCHKNMSFQNLKEIPIFMFSNIISLNLSFNLISDITNLQSLKFLRDLNLDNNEITENTIFPYFPFLETLSLLSNKIQNYPKFISNLEKKCPILSYLVLLKNPCCPLDIALENTDKYKIYRYIIILAMKNLEYLDIFAITTNERKDAHQWKENSYTPLDLVEENLSSPTSLYHRQRFNYIGMYSEGNRFIKDNQL